MRHLNSINQLGRKSADRKAMLANMASSLILHKRISTTTAKARVLRRYVEPLITKSKEDSTHSRRVVFSYLEDKTAVSELFREVAPKIANRPGGYTRILKTGNRLGDSAEMCIIELVDFNENMLAAEGAKTKSTRRRRSSKKKAEGEAATVAAAAPAAEAAVAPPPEAAAETEAVTDTVEEVTDTVEEAADAVEEDADVVEEATDVVEEEAKTDTVTDTEALAGTEEGKADDETAEDTESDKKE
jgi:large subunit ribosomal protein L17